jgi:spore maturation protein CgeB
VFRENDYASELEALGYRDGSSMVLYHDASDLKEKLLFYQHRPQALQPVQTRAREATRANTWEERGRALAQYLRGR